MSLFGDGLGGGLGGGIIGQTLGLARGQTVAPQNVPSAPVNQGSITAQSFGQAVANQINTIGFQFKPCLPPNQTVAQKTLNNKQTECISYLCCITGIDQFQQSCIQELMMNDRKLMRQGGVQPPQGNLTQIGAGMGQPNQPGALNNIGGGGGLFGGGVATQPTQGGGLFGGQTQNAPAAGGLFGGQTNQMPSTGTTGGGLFGGGAQTTQTQGGLFGGQTATAPQTGGLFGGASNPTATGGGLFGGGATNTPAQGGGLFGGGTTATQTQGGLFGGQTASAPQTGGLFGGASNPAAGGGLFGGATNTPAQGGGLFGGAQKQGGLFGTAPQTQGLFGQQGTQPLGGVGFLGQQQNQQQGNQWNSCNEIIEEIRRIEQAKAFSQNKQKEQDSMNNRKIATDKNHINHINYLKSQQQKRNVLQMYTVQNKNVNKFIEAPYTVKVNVNWENIKRNEWQILQRSQDIKNQTYLNMGGEQRMLYSHQNYNNNTLLYNQLRQLERASYQYTSKSLVDKQAEYQKEQLESFSQTSYFKKINPIVQQMEQDKMFSNGDGEESNNKLNETSIQYLYEQSLKNTIKTFDTTVSLKLSEDQDYIIIPLQVKSTYTVSYLITLVFDYIEDNYNINPETLDIYHSNFVLYQPLEIEHLLQVRKDSLISEIETSQRGQIGHFEIIYMDPNEVEDIQNEEDLMEEEDDYFDENSNQDFSYLPIVPDGYQIEPNLKELITKSPEKLKKFKNFKIRNEFAEICFEGEIDLIGRDFSKELLILENEIILYPYQTENQPPVQPGYGLNVQATIKRFNAAKLLLQNEKFDIQKIERRIRKIANDYKMEVVEPYNQKSDSFTVRVLNFK